MQSEPRALLRLAALEWRSLTVSAVAAAGAMACGLTIPMLTERLIDKGVGQRNGAVVVPLALAALALGTVKATMVFVRWLKSGMGAVRVEAALRSRLFAHLQGLPASFHARWQKGQLLARATSDLTSVRYFLGYTVVFIPFFLATAVGVVIMLVRLSPPLALVSVALLVPFVATSLLFNHRVSGATARSREAIGEVIDVVEQSTAGIRVLTAFGRRDLAIARLGMAAERLRRVNVEAVGIRSFYSSLLDLIPNVAVALVLGLGGAEVVHHRLTLGGLVAFNQYLFLLATPLAFGGLHLALYQEARAAGARIFEILDTQPDIADRPAARSLDRVVGHLAFEAVSFRYPGSAGLALQEVSFTVRPGECLAVVGASGSGKSTIASMIPRFIEPLEGRVTLDGVDVSSVTLASLRREVGVVFDEAVLFSGSVRDNVRFACPDADDARLDWAARATGVNELVASLPEGWDTPVGEEGLQLSGGQRQRIALARALLVRPRVLVLDDPLSSVDVETESQIERNLQALRQGFTIVLIAHRASTVSLADRVVFLEGGRVADTGPHQELLQSNPRYRHLFGIETPSPRRAVDGGSR